MLRLDVLMCSFLLDFVFSSGSSEFLCSMTSENAWKEKWTGKLSLLGGQGGGKKYLLHSKISHNNGSSHQVIARVRMDKHLAYSSLPILTKIWYPVREITDHLGLFWLLHTLVFFTWKRAYQYFIASISPVPGSQFMCFCDFELFLSWVYQQTAAPEQICLHVGSKWQLAAEFPFPFTLFRNPGSQFVLKLRLMYVHLTWPYIVQMLYFDIDLLIQRAD